ncbi:MAG: glycosyltransferase family 4 protein [Candidatus Latescibacterota bacterium]
MTKPSLALLTDIPSHYMISCGEALYRLLGDSFRLGLTHPLNRERISLGWKDHSTGLPWIIRSWESERERNRMRECVNEFDAVIFDGDRGGIVRKRIESGGLTFKYTERVFKRGFMLGFPWWLGRLAMNFWPLNLPNFHLLAAGAYCSWDMQRVGMFKNRMWKWGYFPSVPNVSPPVRESGALRMLWAGRMLNWKRVDLLLDAALLLKKKGTPFSLDLIGDGPEKPGLLRRSERYRLGDAVRFHPPAAPEKIWEAMKRAHIYILPSNYREGWGAVINEAMASGCCVIASRGAGAAPWLIEHGGNGYLFPSGNGEELGAILSSLLDHPEQCAKIGNAAWKTITEKWSPDTAAHRLVALTGGLLGCQPIPRFADGPCSVAEVCRH